MLNYQRVNPIVNPLFGIRNPHPLMVQIPQMSPAIIAPAVVADELRGSARPEP